MTVTEDVITKDAAHLSAVEFALGSLGHSLHLPFVGHLLSLNEGAFLCHATLHSPTRWKASLNCYEIAGVSAAFKSLSPTSKKLGPMLSIMMQGILFSLGLILGGRRSVGQALGMFLLSTWAFAQPLLTLLVTFGPAQAEQVVHFYLKKLSTDYSIPGLTVLLVVLGLLGAKWMASVVIVWLLNRQSESAWSAWLDRWQRPSLQVSSLASPVVARSIFRDLLSPLFLFSFILTGTFIFVQSESIVVVIVQLLRPLAIAFVLLYLARSAYFLKRLGRICDRFGFLRPIQRRLMKVRSYWDQDERTAH